MGEIIETAMNLQEITTGMAPEEDGSSKILGSLEGIEEGTEDANYTQKRSGTRR